MPLLGGLFARRQTTPAETASADDHVPPKHIYNLPAAATSSKLRLPFRRRPIQPLVELPELDPPNLSSVTSDSGHALPPPPRKSTLFAAQNSSLHSVHSLPNPSSHSDTPNRQPSQPVKKSPGMFSWTRERSKSKPSSSPPPADDPPSFNLMSFRHVRADSAAPSGNSLPPSSQSLLPPARPRPRGDSVASDSSQRISVAAFKEAQARSRANSPVPSFRPPSTADTLRLDANGRKRASTVSVIQSADSSHSNKPFSPPLTPTTRPAPSTTDTSSDDSEEEDDDDVDSDGVPIPKPARKPTIKRPSGGVHTRSDDQVSHLRQVPPKLSKPAPQLMHHSDQVPYMRQRASVSTSALTPNGAALRASTLAVANSSTGSNAHSKPQSRKPNNDSDEASDSSDADSEDLPLSDLVAPRRPGSSASNYSKSCLRIPAKPLIDINSLATRPPLLTPILRHEDSVKNLNTTRKEQEVEKDQPFSIPAVLAHSSSASSPISPSTSKQNTTPVNTPPSVTHHRRSSGDVPVPKGPDNNDDLINAIRLVGALDKEQEQPSLISKSTSNRIVPTPIRAREPPTSFTVLSRPPQRQSTADTSSSLSPVSQTRFTTSPSSLSSHSDTGARQRASTMVNPVTDKSDTMSVSAHSSTSRTSSRVPPIPLIRSVPDSPSVKESWKPGRPPSAPRTANVPTSTSNKLPQRPFASNRSIRGESPAGSSTGDSSSGLAPFTPRDGSDIGIRSKDDASDVGSTLKARGHAKKPSVTFEDQPIRSRERAKTELTSEEKTRERRRSEAKAALELGKIVNGRGPLVHDEDEDMTLRGRNPTINVTMDNGMMQPGWAAWQQPMNTGMSTMVPPDPAYLAAHQRALLIAKQAYQMAVAQQAMQMAGEDWERSSNMGFSGGSVYGGGSGGSVYGGGSGGSVYGGAGMGPMNMMGMPNMGMLMPPNQWGRSSVAFPSAASVYGISSSQSEFGGGGGWGTRSVYGDSFGPSTSRPTFVGNGTPSSSASAYGGNSRPRASTGASPSSTSSSQPTRAPGKSAVRSRAAPPSSWKSGR